MSNKKICSTSLLNKTSKIKLVVFDFDGVFTDNKVIVMQNGDEAVVCSRADGFGLEMLRKAGVDAIVLSTEVNPVVSARCRKLNLKCIQGCDDKPLKLKSIVLSAGIEMAQVAYMGNDINDLACMKMAGLAAAVADSYPEIISVAHYVTERKGGMGAVREFCELIRSAKKAPVS